LLGADWDGNGLWRTTDVRDWSVVIDEGDSDRLPPDEFFALPGTQGSDRKLYASQTYAEIQEWYDTTAEREAAADRDDPGAYDGLYGERQVGLGWQTLLRPAPGSGTTAFLPDPAGKVWAILYSWRMPGFDIDGDGFVGPSTISATVERSKDCPTIYLGNTGGEPLYNVSDECGYNAETDQPFDDRIPFAPATPSEDGLTDGEPDPTELDGRIVAPEGFPSLACAGGAQGAALIVLLAMAGLKLHRRR
jgi:hypothetical protein